MARRAIVLAVAALWGAGPAAACPCCPTCVVCTCCPSCQPIVPTSGQPTTSGYPTVSIVPTTIPTTSGYPTVSIVPPATTVTVTTTPEPAPPMVCDLNCYGDASTPVPLPGGNGNGVPADTIEACRSMCYATDGCEAIIYGKGMCWGKKDIRTSKCADGDGYVTEMLRENPWGTCSVVGDPHTTTFDARGGAAGVGPSSEFEAGTYWIVKSAELQIQGFFGYSPRFPAAASLIGVAVTGALIQNHELYYMYVGPQGTTGQDGFAAWWDSTPILNNGFPDTYEDQFIQATYSNLDPSDFSNKARSTIGGTSGDLPSYYFIIAPGIHLYALMGQTTMNTVVTMRKLHVEMDGWCGNFDCNAPNDTLPFLIKRGVAAPVEDSVNLFKKASFVPAPLGFMVTKQGHTPSLADCSPATLAKAEKACPSGPQQDACKMDCCANPEDGCWGSDDIAAAAITQAAQHWGLFSAIRAPLLGNLPSGVQGALAILIALVLVGAYAAGAASASRRRARSALLQVAPAAAGGGDDGEEEPLLEPACEHTPLA